MILYYKIGIILSIVFLLLDFKYVISKTDLVEKLFLFVLVLFSFVIPAHYIYSYTENFWYTIKKNYNEYKNIRRIRKVIELNFPKYANRSPTKEETEELIIMLKEIAYFIRHDKNLAEQIDGMIINLTKVMKAFKILKRDVKRRGYE